MIRITIGVGVVGKLDTLQIQLFTQPNARHSETQWEGQVSQSIHCFNANITSACFSHFRTKVSGKWDKRRQCTYNVTLRAVHESVESNKYYIFLCVRASACVCFLLCVCVCKAGGRCGCTGAGVFARV